MSAPVLPASIFGIGVDVEKAEVRLDRVLTEILKGWPKRKRNKLKTFLKEAYLLNENVLFVPEIKKYQLDLLLEAFYPGFNIEEGQTPDGIPYKFLLEIPERVGKNEILFDILAFKNPKKVVIRAIRFKKRALRNSYPRHTEARKTLNELLSMIDRDLLPPFNWRIFTCPGRVYSCWSGEELEEHTDTIIIRWDVRL